MNTVLITGGSRGIGAQAVRAFSDNDWQVAFTYYKSREQAEALARETGALALCCNAANEEETRAMAKEVLSRFHHMDALICNAGTAHTGLFQFGVSFGYGVGVDSVIHCQLADRRQSVTRFQDTCFDKADDLITDLFKDRNLALEI